MTANRTLKVNKACINCNNKKIRCIFPPDQPTCNSCLKQDVPCILRTREKRRKTKSTLDARPHGSPLDSFQAQQNGDSILGSGPWSFPNPQSNNARTDSNHSRGTGTITSNAQMYNMERFDGGAEAGSEQNSPLMSHHSIENVVSTLPKSVPDQVPSIEQKTAELWGCFEMPNRATRQSLIETFFQRCYPWTPILEEKDLQIREGLPRSPLIAQAVFLAASRVSSAPSIRTYASSKEFYERAKTLFWLGWEKDPLRVISATIMLHWMNPHGPEHVSLDNSSFWLSIGVGLSKQVGLHREPAIGPRAGERRRIWWSLVARDCLLAAAHGRPRAIDLEDCKVRLPCLEDFPDSKMQAGLFRAYVDVCLLLGDLAECCIRKHMSRQKRTSLEHGLLFWIRNLPQSLRLSQSVSTTEVFSQSTNNLHVRQLHLPYFETLLIMVRFLSESRRNDISPAAILASSFIAGIFEDFLARDELRFLGPISTLYLLSAGTTLISVGGNHVLKSEAEADLEIIHTCLKELSQYWASADGVSDTLKSMAAGVQYGNNVTSASIWLKPDELSYFEGLPTQLCRLWGLYDSTCHNHPTAYSSEHRPSNSVIRPTERALPPLSEQFITDGATGYPLEPIQYDGIGNWLLNDWDSEMNWQ